MSTASQGFADVRRNMPWWLLGQLIERSSNDEIRTGINKSPQVVQSGTIVVGGATNSHAYIVVINGVSVTYTSDGTALVAEIADGLAVAINAEPQVRGDVSAVSTGVDTVTVTGGWPGRAFTMTTADGQLTATEAVTAAAVAIAIDFARAVCLTGFGGQGRDDLVALAASGLFSAQVATLTPTFVSGAVLTVTVNEVRDGKKVQLFSVSETSATNLATTLAALLAGLNTGLPANSVNVTGGSTNLVFTAEVLGLEFEVLVSSDDSGASVPTGLTPVATTGPSPSTSFRQAFAGVSLRDQAIGAETIGGTEQRFPPNSALAYARKGVAAVESTQTINRVDEVFVELAAGANAGKFYNTSSATRVALGPLRARWEQDANTDTGSLAALRLL